MTDHDPNGIDQHQPGSKLDALKPRPALVLGGFSQALMAVTHVGTYGAIKYTPDGWRFVPEGRQRYSEAMLRHLASPECKYTGVAVMNAIHRLRRERDVLLLVTPPQQ